MTKPTPDAKHRWNQFEQTGRPADYLAYRAAKNTKRVEGTDTPPAPLL